MKLFRAYVEAWVFARRMSGEILAVEGGWVVCW